METLVPELNQVNFTYGVATTFFILKKLFEEKYIERYRLRKIGV